MTGQFHFHYQQQGSGPVVLFLHGFMGSGRDFDAAIARLRDRYTCLTLDLPDHGQTQMTRPAPYTMETVATEILAWLTQRDIPNCMLTGYSMGGRLALYLALTAPERFSHVVLESASPGLRTAVERQARIRLDKERSQQIRQDFNEFLQRWYQAPMFRNLAQQPEFDAIMQRRQQNHPEALARSLRCLGTGQQPSLWPHLPKLTPPTLLMTGEQDTKFCAINIEMAPQLPNAQPLTVPACGHTIHLENPKRYATAIATLGTGHPQ
ncbi:MAG: 2-succinyl-6-hydroxy-2,4-cyclohexadiene-1-carboxylate synthase [Elainellaceae cyanobacterium]